MRFSCSRSNVLVFYHVLKKSAIITPALIRGCIIEHPRGSPSTKERPSWERANFCPCSVVFCFSGRSLFVGLLLLLLLFFLTISSKAISAFSRPLSSFSFLFQVYLNLLTRAFKCQFVRSTAKILVSDGAAGKSYTGFHWLLHAIMSPREEERTLSFAQSKFIYKLTSILVPVGSRKYGTLSDDGTFS